MLTAQSIAHDQKEQSHTIQSVASQLLESRLPEVDGICPHIDSSREIGEFYCGTGRCESRICGDIDENKDSPTQVDVEWFSGTEIKGTDHFWCINHRHFACSWSLTSFGGAHTMEKNDLLSLHT
jgi:hypothetical protein